MYVRLLHSNPEPQLTVFKYCTSFRSFENTIKGYIYSYVDMNDRGHKGREKNVVRYFRNLLLL
jgi:hypothetical protein